MIIVFWNAVPCDVAKRNLLFVAVVPFSILAPIFCYASYSYILKKEAVSVA
jgi:hypothetical protein